MFGVYEEFIIDVMDVVGDDVYVDIVICVIVDDVLC